jgi:hypothetical protein
MKRGILPFLLGALLTLSCVLLLPFPRQRTVTADRIAVFLANRWTFCQNDVTINSLRLDRLNYYIESEVFRTRMVDQAYTFSTKVVPEGLLEVEVGELKRMRTRFSVIVYLDGQEATFEVTMRDQDTGAPSFPK